MRNVTNKVGPEGLNGIQEVKIQGMTPIKIQMELQAAEKVFKAPVDKMAVR